LCTDEDGNTPLHDAARQNAADTVEVLLEHGADISDAVELLLKYRADINAKMKTEIPLALHNAAKCPSNSGDFD